MKTIDITRQITEILTPYEKALANDYKAYLNHCIRVASFALKLSKNTDSFEKIIIASAFHDLGIWQNKTFDYLAPSKHLAISYLENIHKEDWIPDIELMILNHHKITPYSNDQHSIVEIFRKADLIDLSLGLINFNLRRSDIKEIRTIPNSNFHFKLVKLSLKRFLTNPLNPLPMFKI